MSIVIEDPQPEQLARTLAAVEGTSIESVSAMPKKSPRTNERLSKFLATMSMGNSDRHFGSIAAAKRQAGTRPNPNVLGKLYRFLEEITIVVTPFDEAQAHLAAQAFQRFGKGQGHPAQLNLGDCAAHALA